MREKNFIVLAEHGTVLIFGAKFFVTSAFGCRGAVKRATGKAASLEDVYF